MAGSCGGVGLLEGEKWMTRRYIIPCQVRWARRKCLTVASFIVLAIDVESTNWAYFACVECAKKVEHLTKLWDVKPLPAEWLEMRDDGQEDDI